MPVADACGGKGGGQRITAEVGITPRGRHAADIRHFFDSLTPQEREEGLEWAGGVPNGPQLHAVPFATATVAQP
jgi:hypothetical protein